MTWMWLWMTMLAPAQEEGLSPRDLFFDPRPVAVKPPAEPAKKQTISISPGKVEVGPPGGAAAPKPATLATMTLVQLDGAMRDCANREYRPEPRWGNVPETRVFQTGERVRILIRPNTDGYVYMFVRQTSGAVEDLYPMREELEKGWPPVRAFKEAALPALCITEATGNAADNEIWILVTRNWRRAEEFRELLKKSGQADLQYALNSAAPELGSRDIKRDEVAGGKRRPEEPEHAVYRVSSSRSGEQIFSVKLRQK